MYGAAKILEALTEACAGRGAEWRRESSRDHSAARAWESVATAVEAAQQVAEQKGV
jgi:hypothetical protein